MTIDIRPILNLKKFATPRQIEYIDAIDKYGTINKAEKALNVGQGIIYKAIHSLKAKSVLRGEIPELGISTEIPNPLSFKGASIYYGKTESSPAYWLKLNVHQEQLKENLQAWLDVQIDAIKPIEPIPPPTFIHDELCNVIPVGDMHGGLRTWEKEVGVNYNLEIFKSDNKKAIDIVITRAPRAKTALLIFLADDTHADNSSNRTPKSGHALDVDGRHDEVLETIVEVKIHMILRLLETHEKVIVRNNRGNHDPETSWSVNLILWHHFKDEPRVEIIKSPNHYWYYKHGKVMIGTSHGDGIKGQDVLGVMVEDAPQMIGETDYRVMFLGHVHHKDVKDHRGVTIEYARTLAPTDSHHKKVGYRSKRGIEVITFDQEEEVGRASISIKKINS